MIARSLTVRARRRSRMPLRLALSCACAIGATSSVLGCHAMPPARVEPEAASLPAPQIAARESFIPREPRLVPAETLVRSYSAIFGDLLPPEVRKGYAQGNAKATYFGWEQYLSALGMPDYTRDLPRTPQTNTIMVAGFDQLAALLCDRAAGRDLMPKSKKPIAPDLAALVQVKAPPVFAFDAHPGPISIDEFRPRFDVLHRTFLGYPAELAPPERTAEFYALYSKVEARHRTEKKSDISQLSAWSAVCQGLARHPEFHHY